MRLEQEVNIYAKDAMKRRFLAAETSVSVVQGKISALISESEIRELQNSETTMYSKLGKLNMDISGLTQQYSDLTTRYDSVTNQYKILDGKLAEYKTSVDGLAANVSQVSTKLNNDYSTTEAMNTAIKAATDEISLSVSKTYVTSEILSSTKSDLDKQAKNYASNAENLANANTDKLLKNYATSSDLNSAKDRVSILESWKQESSVKITDSAIVATVTKSTEWSNKADKKSLISQINMSTEGISIKSSLIKLEGLVTANNYFKINADGSMETKSATIGGWKVNERDIETESYQGNYGTKTQLLSNNGSSSIAFFKKYAGSEEFTLTTSISGEGYQTFYDTETGKRIGVFDGREIAFFDAKSDIGPSLISGAGGKEIEILPQTILRITAPDGILIKGKISSNKDAYFAGIETGKLAVYGTKKRVVNTDNYAVRSLYCYEMPSPVFGDVGEATLDENGKCIIMIDDIFSETIVTDIEYQVFLQKEGKGDIWVKEKNSNYFEINGTPGLKFAWEIKARQKDYETERLETFDKDAEEYDDIDYASEAAEMVEKFYKELEVA